MLSLSYASLSLSVHKVVAHWPQGSSASAEPVIAALITNCENRYKTTIFVCRAGTDTGLSKDSYSAMSVDLRRVMDLAFFRGNLCALSTHGQLLSGGNPSITGVKYAIKSPKAGSYDEFDEEEDGMVDFLAEEDIKEEYLIESGDQLLKLNQWVIKCSPGDTDSFNVYEADLDATPCRWKPVHSLRGRALFLGRHRYCSSSKSVPVGDGKYGAQEDCIYFIRHAGDSGIYNIRSKKMTRPLVPDREVLERRSWQPWIPTWVFPDPSVVRSHYLKRFGVQVRGTGSELDDSSLDFLLEEPLV